jgi:hypothetical protein
MLDPRTKLLLAMGYAVLIVASARLSWSFAEVAVLLLFIAVIGKTRPYLRWLRMALPMSLFFGAVIWWTADVWTAALAALKLLTLVSVFFVFFSITLPEDLANALVQIGMPYICRLCAQHLIAVCADDWPEDPKRPGRPTGQGDPSGAGMVGPAALPGVSGTDFDSGISDGRGTGRSHGGERIRPTGANLPQRLPDAEP